MNIDDQIKDTVSKLLSSEDMSQDNLKMVFQSLLNASIGAFKRIEKSEKYIATLEEKMKNLEEYLFRGGFNRCVLKLKKNVLNVISYWICKRIF